MYELRKGIELEHVLCVYSAYDRILEQRLECYSMCNSYEFLGEVLFSHQNIYGAPPLFSRSIGFRFKNHKNWHGGSWEELYSSNEREYS